jgi:pentatricopeptide repeat domain-containing protein 1
LVPLDSLLLHLTALAPAPRRSHQTPPPPLHSFLSPAAQALVLAISSHLLPTLVAFLASRRDELLRAMGESNLEVAPCTSAQIPRLAR